MKRLSTARELPPDFSWDSDSSALRAKLRAVTLPFDQSKPESEQCLFTSEEYWVPVSVVNGNVHILPGIPRLCKRPKLNDDFIMGGKSR